MTLATLAERRSLLLWALAPALGLLLAASGYVLIEGWTWSDALWMVVITFTTIGYGEVQPLSGAGRLYTALIILTGVGAGTWLLSWATSQVMEGHLARFLSDRRRKQRMASLQNHIIVIGHGRLGSVVARELHETGHGVCVIERDPQLLAGLSPKIPHIQGDGADDRVLIDAGIHRARGVAVTCAPLADAVFVTLSARQLNPTVTILTRVENAEGGLKARRAGATGVVSPHQMGGWRMAHGLVRPHASNFLDLATLAEHDELLIEDVEVATRSRLDGRSLRGLALPREQRVLIMAVRRASGEMEVTPDGETEMRAGDVLIVVGRPNAVRAFAERARPIG